VTWRSFLVFTQVDAVAPSTTQSMSQPLQRFGASLRTSREPGRMISGLSSSAFSYSTRLQMRFPGCSQVVP
jgi:hypothetical protein